MSLESYRGGNSTSIAEVDMEGLDWAFKLACSIELLSAMCGLPSHPLPAIWHDELTALAGVSNLVLCAYMSGAGFEGFDGEGGGVSISHASGSMG